MSLLVECRDASGVPLARLSRPLRVSVSRSSQARYCRVAIFEAVHGAARAALLCTLREDQVRTPDLGGQAATAEFAQAIVARLHQDLPSLNGLLGPNCAAGDS